MVNLLWKPEPIEIEVMVHDKTVHQLHKFYPWNDDEMVKFVLEQDNPCVAWHGNTQLDWDFTSPDFLIDGIIPALKKEFSVQTEGKRAIWMTRHMPTPEQVADLAKGGYTIGVPDEFAASYKFEFLSQEHFVDIIARRSRPGDIVVAVVPAGWLPYILSKLQVPVLRSVMASSGDRSKGEPKYIWTGEWEQLVSVQITTKPWSPLTA